MSQSYALIGYNFGMGGRTPGAEEAPRKLREFGLQAALESTGAKIIDYGDAVDGVLPHNTAALLARADQHEKSCRNLTEVYAACQGVYQKTEAALKDGHIPLIIGGDHSVSIGSVAAASDTLPKDTGLIWVDTHTDMNTPLTSHSKNIHGMSTAILCGKARGLLSSLQKTVPAIKPENLVFIGCRDLDQAEKDFIREMGIQTYTMKDVDLCSIGAVVLEAVDYLSDRTSGFVASFDLDVCDPNLAPGTGTPIRGGFTFREAHLTIELLHDSGNMRAFELVELNPLLDKGTETSELAISLLQSAVGKSIL